MYELPDTDQPALRITKERTGSVLSLAGQYVGGPETEELRRQLTALSTTEAFVIVDFSQVPFINSAVIGVLLSVHAQYQRTGVPLFCAGMNDHVRKVFDLTKLYLVIPIVPDVEAALRMAINTDCK